jgi:hypothetical protein
MPGQIGPEITELFCCKNPARNQTTIGAIIARRADPAKNMRRFHRLQALAARRRLKARRGYCAA